MRVVLDLGRLPLDASLRRLEEVRPLMDGQDGHEFWIAFCLCDSLRRDALQVACKGLVPAERLVAYELPAPDSPWLHQAEAPLRRHFMAGLEAGVVLDLTLDEGAAAWRERIEAAAASQVAGLAVAAGAARPRLALVSPFPPVRSGVAFHAADLAPHLAEFYALELVTPQPVVEDARLAGLPVRTLEWFEAHAHEFDRIVYQIGNSAAHAHMFDMIRRHPGVAVMHDIFLSNAISDIDRSGRDRQAFPRALYESHGWGALRHLGSGAGEGTAWAFPASRGVIASASAVIVHSAHARALALHWWGADLADRCTVVPLLREAGQAPAREAARQRLGLQPGDFLVCSFGLLGATKRNAELVDAFLASTLAADPHCKLVFVGENVPNAYGFALANKLRAHSHPRITVSGFVPESGYADYLAACDVAVQLRAQSRGETSAAVLDCMANGVPSIVNAHGSTADIDDTCVVKVPDEFSTAELAQALQLLRQDEALRGRLSSRSAEFVRLHHGARAVARRYVDCIEQAARHGAAAQYRELMKTLARIGAEASGADLRQAAAAIASNQPPVGPRQLLVDVSAMVKVDLGTGVQRVVRHVLLEWLNAPPKGFRVEPVFSPGRAQPYRYARRFAANLMGAPELRFEDSVVQWARGDVFLGLDLAASLTNENEPVLHEMRERGVRIFFTVYDLLPVLMPGAFPEGTEKYFRDYLRTITGVAEGIVCISSAVAGELAAWVASQPCSRRTPLGIGHFHLGADLKAPPTPSRLAFAARRALPRIDQRPSLLLVGTIEPRKGHAQALDAARLLWARGVDFNLVIVGKAGWMVDDVVRGIRGSPEFGRRLFWFGHASDALLLQLYARCSALLAASRAEGFGLPMIEAAQQGLPIIARDIPVFREVAGDHAFYFGGDDALSLAAALERWFTLHAQGQHPSPQGMTWLSWEQSARELAAVMLEGRWQAAAPALAPQWPDSRDKP